MCAYVLTKRNLQNICITTEYRWREIKRLITYLNIKSYPLLSSGDRCRRIKMSLILRLSIIISAELVTDKVYHDKVKWLQFLLTLLIGFSQINPTNTVYTQSVQIFSRVTPKCSCACISG